MTPVLVLNCGMDGRDSYSRISKYMSVLTHSLSLVSPFQGCLKEVEVSGSPPAVSRPPVVPHQPSRRLATNQYEISGLTRIFHNDSAAACEHLMDTASVSNCSSGSMKHTAVVAIHHLPCLHQDSRRLATNQYEICGLS